MTCEREIKLFRLRDMMRHFKANYKGYKGKENLKFNFEHKLSESSRSK